MKEQKLKWVRLRNFKCPKCNCDLTTANTGTRVVPARFY